MTEEIALSDERLAVDQETFIRWLREWVHGRPGGKWITHNTAKGAYASLARALSHPEPMK